MFKKKDPDPIFIYVESDSHQNVSHDESNWLVSYADMMTLLCGFFIMLFSMSHMDEPKFDAVKQSLAKQFGGEYTSKTAELAKYATQVIQELGIEQNAMLESDPTGVTIVFENTLFFESLSAQMNPSGKKALQALIQKLMDQEKATSKHYQIVIEGHTDSRPILAGQYPSNWELSAARASHIVQILLNQGFDPDRIIPIGYGDSKPIVDPRRMDGSLDDFLLAKNRRVVLRIMEPSQKEIPIPKTL